MNIFLNFHKKEIGLGIRSQLFQSKYCMKSGNGSLRLNTCVSVREDPEECIFLNRAIVEMFDVAYWLLIIIAFKTICTSIQSFRTVGGKVSSRSERLASYPSQLLAQSLKY